MLLCQWRRSSVFIVNFEHISPLVLVFLLLTLSRQMPPGKSLWHRYFPVNFEKFLKLPILQSTQRRPLLIWKISSKNQKVSLHKKNPVNLVTFTDEISQGKLFFGQFLYDLSGMTTDQINQEKPWPTAYCYTRPEASLLFL